MRETGNKRQGNSYSHILKYTGLFGGVQGVAIIASVVRNKLVALLLGPSGMGLISLYSSAAKFVSDSTSFGLSMSAVKNLSKDFEEGDERQLVKTVKLVRSLSLLAALLGMLVCILCSPLLDRYTFSWSNGHILHYILLSPVVGMTAITGGEMAILRATRQLGSLAAISLYTVLLALLVSVPIYYLFGISGIVPSLVLLALAQMLVTVAYSYRLFPLRIAVGRRIVVEGFDMLRLGIAFVLAGVLGSGAEFLIRSYLSATASSNQVGLYNAGLLMTMTYVGLVFSAMETDYFPRLSSVSSPGPELNRTVNQQVEVMLLLVSPLLVAYIVALPILLPLLYSSVFSGAVSMSRLMVIAMYFRALVLPVEYISLSRGDSKTYLITEAQYDVLVVLLVILGYRWIGLMGVGMAVSAAGFLNLIFVYYYTRWKYGYRPSANVVSYALLQLPLGLLALGATLITNKIAFWVVSSMLIVVSTTASFIILRSKSRLWESLTNKIKKKLHV